MLPRFPLVPAAAVLLLAGAPIPAAQAQPVVVGADQRAGLALTVYEGGFALVHDQRQADLPSGAATIVLSDLSDRLDTTTIRLAAGEGSQIRSLTFERETLSSAALLRRALGKTVRIGRVNPATGEETFEEAEVLAVSPELVVRIADRIETAIPGRVVFDGVPDDLRPAPGIAANLSLPAAGERTLSLSYLTDGLSWKTSYVGRLADGADRLELIGWALIDNQTNTSYPAARLALVSGQVNRAAAQEPPPYAVRARAELAQVSAPQQNIPANVSGPYYRYALPQTFDIGPRQQTQVELIRSASVPFTRTLRTEGGPTFLPRSAKASQPAMARLTIVNDDASGLGVPLPAGLFSLFEAAEGREVFHGGASVTATPVGNEMTVDLGRSFDVTVERTVLKFERTGARNEQSDTTQRLTLKNGGNRPAPVELYENFRGEWRIVRESAPHEQISAFQALWQVTVPPGGEASIEYRAQIGPR